MLKFIIIALCLISQASNCAEINSDFTVSDQIGNFKKPGVLVFLKKNDDGHWVYQTSADITQPNIEQLRVDISTKIPTIYLDAPHLGPNGQLQNVGQSSAVWPCMKGLFISIDRNKHGYSLCNSAFTSTNTSAKSLGASVVAGSVSLLIGSVVYGVSVDQNNLRNAIIDSDFIDKVKTEQEKALADEIPENDAKLISSIRKANVDGMTKALADGANPNIALCLIPSVNYRVRYGVLGSEHCISKTSFSLYKLILDNPYPSQPAMLLALRNAGGQWNLSSSTILNNLVYGTIQYAGPNKDYVPEKINVAKVFYDAGFKFEGSDVESIAANMRHQNNESGLRAIEGIAKVAVLLDAYNAGVLREENARQQAAIVAKQVQDASDALVKSIGQKVCKSVDGTQKHALGVYMGETIYGQAIGKKYYLTAFTEKVAGSKIQLRIASVMMIDRSGALVNVNQLDGDTVMQPNSVLWDDAILWHPCN